VLYLIGRSLFIGASHYKRRLTTKKFKHMMMNDAQRAMMRIHGVLVGRILLGLLFFVSGIQMFMNMGVSGVSGMVTSMGIPLAGLIAVIVLLIKILGGAALIVGYRVGLAAAALFVFTLLTVALVHNNMAELGVALKNLAIMGGLLYVMAFGVGEGWSIGKTTSM